MKQTKDEGMKYKKKSLSVQAVKFTGSNWDECKAFAGDHFQETWGCPNVQTLEGVMEASAGDWIIKGVKGEFYPCKPDVFAMTYERVKEPDGNVHVVPVGPDHFESRECWCGPELREDFTDQGGKKVYVHREVQ